MASSPASDSHLSHESPHTDHDVFQSSELALVLSQYPIGPIESTRDFPRGSRRSPKAIITTPTRQFLLKRRAPGKNNLQRVAFNHALQMHLSAKHFPLPQLINTTDGQSFSHLPSAASAQSPASAPSENIYELFEFIPAAHYPQTLEATENAGYTLALYHQSLLDFTPAWEPGPSSYHRARALAQNFTRIAAAGQVPTSLLDSLQTLVTTAAEAVDASGYSTWPKRIIHADWHPGNMLFREDRVVAVLDFDSARRLPIAIDLANGALQFSMIDGDENPAKWPDQTDESRYRKFLHGYRQLAAFSSAESAVLPWLMIEALIAEAVYPIAATGTFGRISGDIFLHMVARKANWLALHAHHLIQLAESA